MALWKRGPDGEIAAGRGEEGKQENRQTVLLLAWGGGRALLGKEAGLFLDGS